MNKERKEKGAKEKKETGYIIVSNCCGEESDMDSGRCSSCKSGCGFVKLYDDGREVDLE